MCNSFCDVFFIFYTNTIDSIVPRHNILFLVNKEEILIKYRFLVDENGVFGNINLKIVMLRKENVNVKREEN